ncbi:hypothetical protein G3N55_08400 [Dissulfurirhabdus thermomarina]|uniref:Mut7-C RNAse domain-containing protein n=1 Tax=Dissulfurirhabdus thermomarina TaxID=1765737 RepID=A0A6N9TNI8_DISTH|nr:Mut7-C RNAse domain-containing protein [Dissulfurirhabdus thermomarina]NDY42862.1 hypothetical protein [Dissulfurirhabdus thermomarina]NMX24440.1 DUF5615 family PIN-like protein [Dissulfurirhabdus thermomarina]
MRAEAPRFLADAMLGRLARWLRLLGVDCAYLPHLPDAALLALARCEGRILVTRDRELARRAGAHGCLLAETEIGAELRRVVTRFGLPAAPAFTRCLRCNRPVRPVHPAAARPFLPPAVGAGASPFTRCPACRRLYWRGGHARRAAARLEAMLGGTERGKA